MKQDPKKFEEIAPAACLSADLICGNNALLIRPQGDFQGSAFVSRRAGAFLQSTCFFRPFSIQYMTVIVD